MSTKRRLTTVFFFVVTIALAGAAILIGYQLQRQQTNPDDTEAASQQVWDAELLRNQSDRDAFAQRWAALANSSFEEKKAFVDKEGARFKTDTPILTVGAETLYGRDLNYYMFLLQYDVYTSSKPLTDFDVDKGIDVLINNSLILQKAQELKLTTLDASVYNTVGKEFRKRNELVSAMLPLVSTYFIDTAEGESVTIWFNNNFIPVSVEEGRKIAKVKIDELYSKLKTGQITMLEAAEIITKDEEILTKVDPAAVSNAYQSFKVEKGGPQPFLDPALNDSIFSLGEGQMSLVLVAKNSDDEDINGPQAGEDIAFVIIKVNKRSFADKYVSTEQLFEKTPDGSIQTGETKINLKRGITPTP